MSTRSVFLGIILLSAVVRLWYISYAGSSIVIKPDSQGYYAEKGFFGTHTLTNFFNPNRTPGYTMLTDLVIHDTPAYGSYKFLEQAKTLIYIQTVVSLASLIFLYDTLLAVKISKIWSLVFVGFTGVNIYQFIWDQAFLTESLYISLFMILMRLFVSLVKKPTATIGMIFTLIAAYSFILRPAGLAIPYLLLPIVWMVHRTKKVLLLITLLLCVYTAVPALFVGMNKYLHNYHGLSFNTDFAVFGRILLFNIPVDAATSVPNLYHKVQEYRAMGGNISIPWYFFVYYGNEVYGRLSELQEFNRLVIMGEFTKFAQSVISDIPKAFFDTEMYGVLYRAPTPSASRVFFDTLDWIIRMVQKTTIVFLLLIIPTIWLFMKKRTTVHAFLFAIVVVELYQLFSSLIFGGAWEFARHMITTQTYLFFFCFWWVATILRFVARAKEQ